MATNEALEIKRREKMKKDLLTKMMKGDWKEVVDIYQKEAWTRKEKITMSGETALHIAVYVGQKEIVKELIEAIKFEQDQIHAKDAVNVQNMQGNTALHFAASTEEEPVMCEYIAEVDSSLVGRRNNEGETPFFLAAFHGKKDAFLCLHRICSKNNPNAGYEYSIRNDGNTILHSAINGQHFDLAFQITHLYENLVNEVNIKGLSPLHILAAKPSAFRSGSHLGTIWNRAMYKSIYVPKLMPEQPRDDYRKPATSVPKLASTPTGGQRPQNDIETQLPTENSGDKSAGHHDDKETCCRPISQQACRDVIIFILQLASIAVFIIPYIVYMSITALLQRMTLLLPLGIKAGYGRRRMMERRKNSNYYSVIRKHIRAVQIMNQLLEHTELYQGSKTWGDSSTNHDPDQSDRHGSATHDKKYDHIDQDWELTPILTAAKYGVIEMVERILELYPIAIYDKTTVTKKNIVLLAVEYRQIHVYEFLLQKTRTIPRDSVFGHLDKDGNTALHIAAKLAPGTPGMIPGLRMLWEIKWYKYVKWSMPPSLPLHNKDGETPIGLFNKNHKELVENGGNWLSRTSESSSVVATLIAGVAFATATNIPGGLKQDSDTRTSGENKVALYIFAISSLVALFSSVSSVVLFFALMSSSFEVKNFSSNLPKKLLMGLVTLFIGIASILISFCTQHIFMLQDMKNGALVLYTVVVALVIFMTIKNSSVFLNLLRLTLSDVPAPQRLNEDDF